MSDIKLIEDFKCDSCEGEGKYLAVNCPEFYKGWHKCEECRGSGIDKEGIVRYLEEVGFEKILRMIVGFNAIVEDLKP